MSIGDTYQETTDEQNPSSGAGQTDTGQFEPASVETIQDCSLEDVYGLQSQINTLRETVLNPIKSGTQATDLVYFEGAKNTGKTTLARATAGELSTDGYSAIHVDSYPDDQEDCQAYIEAVVEKSIENEPIVLIFEKLDGLATAVDNIESVLTTIRTADESVLLIGELRQKRDAESLPVPDITAKLPAYDVDRRAGILKDTLAAFEEEPEFRLKQETMDYEALGEQLKWHNPTEVKWLTTACKLEAHQRETNEITHELTEAAIRNQKEIFEQYSDNKPPFEASFDTPPTIDFSDITSLTEQVNKLNQTVVHPLHEDPASGPQLVYFDGALGSGKTRLAKATAGELASAGFSYTHIQTNADGQIQTERHLKSILDRARDCAPSVVLIENFENVLNYSSHNQDHSLEAIWDSDDPVVILGELGENNRSYSIATGHNEDKNPDTYVKIPDGDDTRTEALFRHYLGNLQEDTVFNVEFTAMDFETIVEELEWSRPADFERIATRASYHARGDDTRDITQEHVERAINELKEESENDPTHPHGSQSGPFGRNPSDQQDRHYFEDTSVSFEDVGGLDDTIQQIRERTVYPQQHPELFENTNLEQTSGLLLHGPPGNGKTLLARALANEMDRTFLSVRGPELKNKWFGESERRIRELFEIADEEAPSLVFFDEFDAVAPARDACSNSPTTSVVNMLLSEMDGLEERGDIVFLAATNRIGALDEAVLRPGRIGETIEITPPDQDARGEIFDIHTTGLPLEDDVTAEWFSDVTADGLSGAEIEAICRRAVHKAIRDADESPVVEQSHVTEAREAHQL